MNEKIIIKICLIKSNQTHEKRIKETIQNKRQKKQERISYAETSKSYDAL